MAHTPVQHASQHAHGSDMAAAFAGLVVGVIALVLILGSIVALTNRYYAGEKPAAEASH